MKPIKDIYVAASVEAQLAAAQLALRLTREGYSVTSRWIEHDFNQHRWKTSVFVENLRREWGEKDLEDVMRADAVVLLSDVPSTTGGFHVELGVALGAGKDILVLGSAKWSVFYYLPRIEYYQSADSLLAGLGERGRGAANEAHTFVCPKPIWSKIDG